MSIYYPDCSTTISDPSCSDCPTKELGDIRSVFFVDQSSPFLDITDPSEWATKINAREVYVFPYTRGSLAQTATESAGFGDAESELSGYEYVLDVTEPNYQSNFNFWNTIKNSRKFRVGYRTESLVHLSENEATIIPMQPVDEDKKAGVFWKIQIKFGQDDLIEPFAVPSGIFDRCLDVQGQP